MTTTTAFDIATMARALEERDTDAAIAQYAAEAELRIVDATTPPSAPRVVPGRDAIRDWLTDINVRDMTHRVTWTAQQDDRAALALDCTYPDGTKVLCVALFDTADGQITHQLISQSWDS
jgi:hypothetical protein